MAKFTNIHRGARMSAKKVMPLMTLIRGKRIDEADAFLALSKKRSVVFVRQALKAAIANADQAEVDKRRLFVVDARVDGGPMMKRFQPKDRGRAHRILKRTCHITVAVEEQA